MESKILVLQKVVMENKMNYKRILDGVQQQLTKSVTLPQPTVDIELQDDGDIHKKSPQEGLVESEKNQEVVDSQKQKVEELRPDNTSDQAPIGGEEISQTANENETPEMELQEYKKDFLEMNIGSLSAIMNHAKSILESMDQASVKNNLTESWLQGKIAITEDYMRTIHDFVKYVSSDDDTEDMAPASLWENIRKKKLRKGKNYKPAKPGDKDRPDKEAWKRAQNS
jgi:hypothetical protein